MEFSKQEYWNGEPFPSPEDLPDPRIEPRSSALQANSLPSEPPWKTSFTGGNWIKMDVVSFYIISHKLGKSIISQNKF